MQYLLAWIDPTAGSSPWVAVLLSMGAGGAAIALALRRRRRAPHPEAQPSIQDILGTELKRSAIAESSGVRWEVLLYPETLSVPGYAVLTTILQNATDAVRTVTLEIAPGPLLPHGHSASVALNGGEAGILRTPLFISRTTPIGHYTLSAILTARMPRGEGKRLLPPPTRPPATPRTASLHIVSAHESTPVNLFAYDWKGFTSLYIPPERKPDFTELRILQELPSFPGGD